MPIVRIAGADGHRLPETLESLVLDAFADYLQQHDLRLVREADDTADDASSPSVRLDAASPRTRMAEPTLTDPPVHQRKAAND